MRRIPLFLIALALGCADGMGPVFAPCPSSSSSELCGTWAADSLVTGSSLILNVRLHDDSISGNGTYSMEAGRSGVLQLLGTFHAPAIALTLRYDNGQVETYSGTVLPSQQITGTLADTNGHSSTMTFTPR